jgi:hypothetical protein
MIALMNNVTAPRRRNPRPIPGEIAEAISFANG